MLVKAGDCGVRCEAGRDGINLPTRLTRLGEEETLLRLLVALPSFEGRLCTDESLQEIRPCGVEVLANAA